MCRERERAQRKRESGEMKERGIRDQGTKGEGGTLSLPHCPAISLSLPLLLLSGVHGRKRERARKGERGRDEGSKIV